MIYQWDHPHRVLFFFLFFLLFIQSMRDQQQLEAKQKKSGSEIYLQFPIVLVLHLMVMSFLYIVGGSMCTSDSYLFGLISGEGAHLLVSVS